MRRFLLDTGIAGDFISRRAGVDRRARQRRAAGDVVGICTPVLGELLFGIEQSATRQHNMTLLWRAIVPLKFWTFDLAAAEEYGRLYALLQKAGRPMQQIDIQIAAVAFALGNCTVVTKNSDFAAIPGLAVEDWSVP